MYRSLLDTTVSEQQSFDYPAATGYMNAVRCVIGNTWVVKVELALECLGLLFWREDPVETILAEDGHLPLVVVDLVLPQQLHDLAAHRRLAIKAMQKQDVHFWNLQRSFV